MRIRILYSTHLIYHFTFKPFYTDFVNNFTSRLLYIPTNHNRRPAARQRRNLVTQNPADLIIGKPHLTYRNHFDIIDKMAAKDTRYKLYTEHGSNKKPQICTTIARPPRGI